MARKNRYTRLIEYVFLKRYNPGDTEVPFERSDIVDAARELEMSLPKNLGDVIYAMRYRTPLPDTVVEKAAQGQEWVIRPAGRSKYVFSLSAAAAIVPRSNYARTKIPDSTPGLIEKYALGDEQALLAKLRYNRLVDIFTGLTCYSLQSHLRTSLTGIGQVETDEVYVGLGKTGAHYVIPVEAKSARDRIGTIQIEQDFAMCRSKFPGLIALPVAAQTLPGGAIAVFSFGEDDGQVVVVDEKHYALVPPDELTEEELGLYGRAAERIRSG